MSRTLVNLPEPCAGTVNPCATVETAEAVHGPPGLAGPPGPQGEAGSNGWNAFTFTTAPFYMPAVDGLASVGVQSTRGFFPQERVFIAGVGYFQISEITSLTAMVVRNLGGTSTLPAGALVGSGLKLTSGGQPGADADPNPQKRYAFIAHIEPRGTNGGPLDVQYGASGGEGAVRHFQKIIDPDNIVTFGPSEASWKLPIGAWKIRGRVPGYFCRAFQASLRQIAENGAITILCIGNGAANFDQDATTADPQTHAIIDAIISVTDPGARLEVRVRQESWSFGRNEPYLSRAKGVASDFDDGAGVDVPEMFTTVEIEEL